MLIKQRLGSGLAIASEEGYGLAALRASGLNLVRYCEGAPPIDACAYAPMPSRVRVMRVIIRRERVRYARLSLRLGLA